MESILYLRIKSLCNQKGITIKTLEDELGFGNSTIQRWKSSSPSTDKLNKVAKYFGVSLDYLVGNAEIRETADSVLNDGAIISIQRARERMQEDDKDKSMQMLKIGFGYAFED